MMVDETQEVKQSFKKKFQRNSCFRISRKTSMQLGFCRCEELSLVTNNTLKSTAGVYHRIFRIFRMVTFKNNFERLLLKRKQKSRRAIKDPYGFRFSLFPVQSLINHTNPFSLWIFAQRSFRIWIILSILTNLRKDLGASKSSFYCQDFRDRNIWVLLSKYYFMKIFAHWHVNEYAIIPSVVNSVIKST